MFFRRRFFPVFFIAILGFMMLGSMRSSAYRYGYFNGYTAAQTTNSAEAAPDAAPAATDHYGHYGYHGYGFFGGFFRILFTFFFLSFLFKMFFWRRHWHRHHHWKKHYRGGSCYGDGDTRSAKEKAADAAAAAGVDYTPKDL